MRLSMFIRPFTDENLSLAAQVGVEEVVIPFPGLDLEALRATRRRVESFGMRLTHVERKLPHLKLVHGLPGWERQLEDIRTLIRNMGEAGLEVLCYNWMPDEDWMRTTCEAPARGRARATAFDAAEVGRRANVTDADGRPAEATPADALWENLERFLEAVVPEAEAAGIRLALHPDDPPIPELNGQERIVVDNAALRRAIALVDHPANGICYCTGTLGLHGQQHVLEGIAELGDRIHFVHLRNVRGTPERFTETWHDDGQLDLAAVVRALAAAGFRGTLRPDHAPSMAGEPNDAPGYEMRGRLFAAGYLRGLIDAL